MPFHDRVKVATTTTGTGTVTLGAAEAGYQTFADGDVVDGEIVTYGIEEGTAAETGIGTYGSAGPTLTRTLRESTTGSLLNLTGSAKVFLTPLAVEMNQMTMRGAMLALAVGMNSI